MVVLKVFASFSFDDVLILVFILVCTAALLSVDSVNTLYLHGHRAFLLTTILSLEYIFASASFFGSVVGHGSSKVVRIWKH